MLSLRPICLLALALGGLAACDSTPKPAYAPPTAKCATDGDCAKGFICEGEGDARRCNKGERSAAHIAEAQKKALAEKEAKAAAAKAVKPGEGRLYVRLCPGYNNTPESIGSVVAVHTETKARHILNLALALPEGGWETEFAFPSVPLGTYEVTANYGIQVRGQPDTHPLLCDEKVRKTCEQDGKVRKIEVVLPENEAPREKDKDGTFKRRPCDFSAE